MAKVRVYELAKELNLDSNDLLEKLIAGGMSIKNHMGTLDEEAVLRAKEIVTGAVSVSEVIEESRIKPTVIRRRRKIITIEQEVSPEKAEEQAGVERAEALEPEALPPEKTREQEEAAGPARIGERPEKEAVIQEVVVSKEVSGAVQRVEEKALTPEEVLEKRAEAGGMEPALPAEEEVKPAVVEVKPKPRKGKKKKTDRPAKIISRPEEGPLRDILAKEAEKKEMEFSARKLGPVQKVHVTPVRLVEELVETPTKEKPIKKKKEKKETEKQEIAVRTPIRYRKKEVYERADLYEGRAIRPKERKAGRKLKEVPKIQKQTEITVPKAIKRRIKVQELVTVAELARAMGTKGSELLKRLISLGVVANINQHIDFETASLVADEFGYELALDTFKEESVIAERADRPEDLKPRPPVVTIMGHVDHGKTSLLDHIRKSNIIGEEFGGITQHIGAYYVESERGDIAFLDTPGHEAFTAMRARGAKVTDIIVLVVAAEDGAMPQTREAINHARAANIPIVVAINKIDKPDANPEKVRRELAELDLSPEEWGGETLFGEISAKTGEGVDDLLGLILLQAEMLELTGNPNKPGRGTIIEAKLDKSQGPAATVLVKDGTLHQGDYFICGENYGRVRGMYDQLRRKVEFAGPSVPVEIYGISGVPMAGDEIIVVQDEKTAKQVVEYRKSKSRKQDVGRRKLVSLDDLFERIQEGDVKELNIVLKTDVQGSLEALSESMVKQSTGEVKLKIIHAATGAITESDVMLASASGAIIIGFNVRANPRVSEVAEKEKVDVRYYDVIYNVIKDIRLAMAGLLEPVYKEHIIGRADIKEIFRIPKVGTVAGCHVTVGHVERNSKVRLLRDDVVIFDGRIASLRRFKEDAKDVQSGYECGIGVENFQDMKPGDVFEVYQVEEVQAEL
ncbi:MAG TPA: translation initiation factor IF-2 [Acidobacteriota bacterium]|nr:translation initiation factor IF-2 [Acidobacteriota bacterium]